MIKSILIEIAFFNEVKYTPFVSRGGMEKTYKFPSGIILNEILSFEAYLGCLQYPLNESNFKRKNVSNIFIREI